MAFTKASWDQLTPNLRQAVLNVLAEDFDPANPLDDAERAERRILRRRYAEAVGALLIAQGNLISGDGTLAELLTAHDRLVELGGERFRLARR